MTCAEANLVVDRFLDGELEPAERDAMAVHVGACAACARLVDERQALARLVRAVPSWPAPASLGAAIGAARRRRSWTRGLSWAAVLVAAVSLGGAAIAVRERRAAAEMAQAIADDHVRALAAQRLVDVRSSDQHTVKPWFLGRLDFAPPVDDPAAEGFPLVGGRVGSIEGRTVAVLVYRRRLHPIAVYVWPAGDAPATRAASQSVRGFHLRHWNSGEMSWWVVSDVSDDELDAFVAILRR